MFIKNKNPNKNHRTKIQIKYSFLSLNIPLSLDDKQWQWSSAHIQHIHPTFHNVSALIRPSLYCRCSICMSHQDMSWGSANHRRLFYTSCIDTVLFCLFWFSLLDRFFILITSMVTYLKSLWVWQEGNIGAVTDFVLTDPHFTVVRQSRQSVMMISVILGLLVCVQAPGRMRTPSK